MTWSIAVGDGYRQTWGASGRGTSPSRSAVPPPAGGQRRKPLRKPKARERPVLLDGMRPVDEMGPDSILHPSSCCRPLLAFVAFCYPDGRSCPLVRRRHEAVSNRRTHAWRSIRMPPARAAAARNSNGAVSRSTSRSTRPSSKTRTASTRPPCGSWTRSPPSTRQPRGLGPQGPAPVRKQPRRRCRKGAGQGPGLNPHYPFGHYLRGSFRRAEGELPGALLLFRKAASATIPRPATPWAALCPDRRHRAEAESSRRRPGGPANGGPVRSRQ